MLDAHLTDGVAALLAAGAVTLKRVAQDGVRIRARAGPPRFGGERNSRRASRKRAQMAHLKQQGEDDPGAPTRRRQAARERVARKRQARLEPALARLPELAEIKAKQGKPPETARASITDAEARVIKMADGGFRPAYNGQFATDTASQVIVGVDAVTVGTDRGQLAPMLEQVGERYARVPAQCGSSAQSAVEIHPIHSVLRPPNAEADRRGAGATFAFYLSTGGCFSDWQPAHDAERSRPNQAVDVMHAWLNPPVVSGWRCVRS